MNTVLEEVPIKYFAMIPHVIYELGLNAYEISVYCLLKRISCENSACTYSNENLAKLVNISVSQLKRVKKKLSEHFSLLNSPLIICTERRSKTGSNETTEIKIVNIWPQNVSHFDTKKAEKQRTELQNLSEIQNSSTGSDRTTPPGSDRTTKKNPGLKNIKEINKEKFSTESSQGNGFESVSESKDGEVKSAIFPFSFDKKEMGEIYDKVKDICHDKRDFVKVLEFAEADEFWKGLIKNQKKAIRHFKSVYEQAQKVIAKDELILKRKQLAKSLQFQGVNGYSLADDEGYNVISANVTYQYKYNRNDEFWAKYGL